jgi:MOSC domain-containing protein YiiM
LPDPVGRLESVNVGRPRPVMRHGSLRPTAIAKAPVDGPVAVFGVNVEGDDQADCVPGMRLTSSRGRAITK